MDEDVDPTDTPKAKTRTKKVCSSISAVSCGLCRVVVCVIEGFLGQRD